MSSLLCGLSMCSDSRNTIIESNIDDNSIVSSPYWSENTINTETDNTLKQRKRSKSRVRSRSIQTKIGTVLLFETDAMEKTGENTVNDNSKSKEMMINANPYKVGSVPNILKQYTPLIVIRD